MISIHVQAMDVNEYVIMSFHCKATNLRVFSKLVKGSVWCSAAKAHGLLEDMVHESQITDLFVRKLFSKSFFVASSFRDALIKFSSGPFKAIFALDKVHQSGLDCILRCLCASGEEVENLINDVVNCEHI